METEAQTPPVEQAELLPDPEPAPPQYWNNIYFPSHRVEDVELEEPDARPFPLEVNDLFLNEEAEQPVEMAPIEIPGPPEPESTDGPFQNVQFPLDQTLGDSVEEEVIEQQQRAAREEWSPIVLGDGNVFSNAMERAGLQWSDRQFSFAIIPQGDGDFGISTYTLRATTAQRRAEFIRITPRFTWHAVNGPVAPDVTSNLYGGIL